jgi:hypothetical protein
MWVPPLLKIKKDSSINLNKNIKIKIRNTDQIKSRGRIHALHVKARYFLLYI